MKQTATSFLFQYAFYQPTITPVDYGGSYAYAMELFLINGQRISHSSFELEDKEKMDEDTRFRKTLEKMALAVEHLNIRPRCDFLDAQATASHRAALSMVPVKLLVSACLCGEKCRYDGTAGTISLFDALVQRGEVIPVCPECAGGLSCPRPPCERRGNRIFSQDDGEETDAFQQGAERTLKTARIFGVTQAVFKERSPSCGVHFIYDGTFTKKVISGEGITAGLLREQGITLYSEEDYPYGVNTDGAQ